MTVKKYLLTPLETEKPQAGSKAKNDISIFLHEIGFLNMFIDSEINKYEKRLFFRTTLRKKFSMLNNQDILAIQYPFYMGDFVIRVLIEETRKKGLKTVLIIHDIDSLREHYDDPIEIKKEINFLNGFSVIISHNGAMTKWLMENGCKSPIIDLEIFDYRMDAEIVPNQPTDNGNRRIIYAGNLEKAIFLNKMNPNSYKLLLFGKGMNLKNESVNIEYKGSFTPQELLKHMNGEFGLVWDGLELERCSGNFGHYLQFNNPHKTSLYISCGLPVIIWKKAALADWIVENNIGISIDSLLELDSAIHKLSEEQYIQMRKNVTVLSTKLREGYFIKRAMQAAIEK